MPDEDQVLRFLEIHEMVEVAEELSLLGVPRANEVSDVVRVSKQLDELQVEFEPLEPPVV